MLLGLVGSLVLASACSAGSSGTTPVRGGGSSGSGGASLAIGNGGNTLTIDPPPPPPDGGRPMRCDSSGHCSCINVASFGRPAHYGNGNDNTDAFQSWLNSKSSANVELITTHTELTSEFLKNYDVLILQALEDGEYGPFWSFSDAEVQAVADWVKAGGGVISLMGYGGDPREIEGTNRLLSFSGISYNGDDILTTCANNLCYCWGNSIPITTFTSGHPISANLTQIGAFHGRSINAGDATVISSSGTTNIAVAKTMGSGKVFAFADEWVTYTSQWLGTGQQQAINTYDPCYDAAHGYMMTADKVFQVPQFWYNSIKWAAPVTQCDFTIDNPTIVK